MSSKLEKVQINTGLLEEKRAERARLKLELAEVRQKRRSRLAEINTARMRVSIEKSKLDKKKEVDFTSSKVAKEERLARLVEIRKSGLPEQSEATTRSYPPINVDIRAGDYTPALTVAEQARKVEQEKILDQIFVDRIISYQGENYKVTGLPSEENKNKYILEHSTGKPIYKLTKEQLTAQIENGNAELVPSTPSSELKPHDPVLEEAEDKIPPPPDFKTSTPTPKIPKPLETTAQTPSRLESSAEVVREARERQEPQKETTIFTLGELDASLREIISGYANIKSIDVLEFIPQDDTLLIHAIINARKLGIKSRIELHAVLVNKGGSIKIQGYSLTATQSEEKIRELFAEHIDSIGTEIKKQIEKKEGKKVEKVEIVNGELKVTFKSDVPLRVGKTLTPITQTPEEIAEQVEEGLLPEQSPATRRRYTPIDVNIRAGEKPEHSAEIRKKEIKQLRKDYEAEQALILRLEKQLEEIRNKKAETELLELPEDIKKIIDEEMDSLRKSEKRYEVNGPDNMLEFTRAEIKLLESDPIKYFTREKTKAEGMVR